jgi:hypothetical protein
MPEVPRTPTWPDIPQEWSIDTEQKPQQNLLEDPTTISDSAVNEVEETLVVDLVPVFDQESDYLSS